MQTYSVRDVERVLRLSRSAVRGLINGGFVTPTRGPRRQYRFSFQDLIVLRTAQALTQAKLSRRRITRSLNDLRRSLPETIPLSGLNISAVGDRVVVRDGQKRWQADDGQYLLELDVSLSCGVLKVVERAEPGLPQQSAPAKGTSAVKPADAGEWFQRGMELEETDPRAAKEAYHHAANGDPQNTAAWINWGRLLHEQGRLTEAERVYRRALRHGGRDPLLLFNLGVVLEDLGQPGAALETYQQAIGEDPMLADCHYNIARLYESFGKPQHAIRHLGEYRRLLSRDAH
jgi:tetratricopeptide (TPR) repeat protein